MVPTWPVEQELSDIETPMLVTSSELDGKVQESVQRQMEMFIEDFLEANPDFEPKTDTSNLMSGTIRYVRIEGGFYAIYGDNGEQYNPINLPRAFKKDGLRVAFQAIKSKRTPGILYPGLRIEITRIRKISN